MESHGHVPVLAEETLALLDPRRGDVAVDCTAGRGGHAVLLARAIAGAGSAGEEGLLVAFDLDADNLAHACARVEGEGVPFAGFRESFANVEERLRGLGRRADVVLADLGFSSNQVDDPARGLSFREEGPLDMRLDRLRGPTAAELLETLTEDELAEVIATWGEDPLARKIARNLARTRLREPIQSTTQLARLVLEAYGGRARSSRIHPATRTFMALRIAVNAELVALTALLEAIRRGAERAGEGWLNAEARVGVIAFHSLEDRLVKQAFSALARRGLATRLTKKPVTAGAPEVQANVRARSARLRVIRLAERGIRAARSHGPNAD